MKETNKYFVIKGGEFYTGLEFTKKKKDARKYNLETATMVAVREGGMVWN